MDGSVAAVGILRPPGNSASRDNSKNNFRVRADGWRPAGAGGENAVPRGAAAGLGDPRARFARHGAGEAGGGGRFGFRAGGSPGAPGGELAALLAVRRAPGEPGRRRFGG